MYLKPQSNTCCKVELYDILKSASYSQIKQSISYLYIIYFILFYLDFRIRNIFYYIEL